MRVVGSHPQIFKRSLGNLPEYGGCSNACPLIFSYSRDEATGRLIKSYKKDKSRMR